MHGRMWSVARRAAAARAVRRRYTRSTSLACGVTFCAAGANHLSKRHRLAKPTLYCRYRACRVLGGRRRRPLAAIGPAAPRLLVVPTARSRPDEKQRGFTPTQHQRLPPLARYVITQPLVPLASRTLPCGLQLQAEFGRFALQHGPLAGRASVSSLIRARRLEILLRLRD